MTALLPLLAWTLVPLGGPLAAPGETTVISAPRLDFVDEICRFDWDRDVWACDPARLARTPVETIEVEPGLVPMKTSAHRFAIDEEGGPTLLPPEERGQDPDNWGPKPMWACISGVEVTAPADTEVRWDEAAWSVNGEPRPAKTRPMAKPRTAWVQTAEPPCVGPRLFFQSDRALVVELKVPYVHRGDAASLIWRYRLERKGVDEITAMRATTPPRRWRGSIPEPPETRTITSFMPVGTCIGALATGVGLAATAVGTAYHPPSPEQPPWPLASAAVAAIPLAAGVIVDGSVLGLWLVEGIEHFRYQIAQGTQEHWERSRAAYERKMQALGLEVPVDY